LSKNKKGAFSQEVYNVVFCYIKNTKSASNNSYIQTIIERIRFELSSYGDSKYVHSYFITNDNFDEEHFKYNKESIIAAHCFVPVIVRTNIDTPEDIAFLRKYYNIAKSKKVPVQQFVDFKIENEKELPAFMRPFDCGIFNSIDEIEFAVRHIRAFVDNRVWEMSWPKKLYYKLIDGLSGEKGTQRITKITGGILDTHPPFSAPKKDIPHNRIVGGVIPTIHPVPKNENTIFLSYCSKESDLADIVDFTFSAFSNIRITRYTRDVKYRDSFKDFMKKIKKHDFVIMLISDNFLKSQACMFEVSELLSDDEFKKKLLFIIVADKDEKHLVNNPPSPIGAKVYSSTGRNDYVVFWENVYEEVKASIDKIESDSAKIEPSHQLREIRRIIDHDLSPFLNHICDACGLSFDEAYSDSFAELRSTIGLIENSDVNDDVNTDSLKEYLSDISISKFDYKGNFHNEVVEFFTANSEDFNELTYNTLDDFVRRCRENDRKEIVESLTTRLSDERFHLSIKILIAFANAMSKYGYIEAAKALFDKALLEVTE